MTIATWTFENPATAAILLEGWRGTDSEAEALCEQFANEHGELIQAYTANETTVISMYPSIEQ